MVLLCCATLPVTPRLSGIYINKALEGVCVWGGGGCNNIIKTQP